MHSEVCDERDESFEDQRLSDLLPKDFINLVGLDPNQYLFASQSRRRMTEPAFPMSAQELSLQRRYSSILSPYGGYAYAGCAHDAARATPAAAFRVQLVDADVIAYTNCAAQFDADDGVVVLDGQYLRLGRIVQQLDAGAGCEPTARRIVGADRNCMLSDYVFGQTQIANALMPAFLQRCGIQTDLLGIELVSYQARALLRIRLRNAAQIDVDELVRLVIQAFQIAVEVYE